MTRLVWLTIIFVTATTGNSSAQFAEQQRVLNYTNTGFRSAATQILNRPTVSPYLALADLTGNGEVDPSRNYFMQVKPRLESMQEQQRQERSLVTLQQNVQQLRSASALQTNRGGVRSTGHPTRFGSYLHYYPGFGR